jgi:hypothetical protein
MSYFRFNMRLRLLFISLTLIIFSAASGFGLRYALAVSWTEPLVLPPGGNVPAPINIGSGAQIKTGDLTIGGNFVVNSGQVVGAPAGGNLGIGSINAQKICINGDCLTSWAGGQAFVQDGNAFGVLATLGTNDNFSLAFETNKIGRMSIDTAGNVGIGTTSPSVKLQVAGGSLRIGTPAVGDVNPFLDLYSTTTISKIQNVVGHLSFGHPGAVEEAMTILPAGNVGIGTTNPLYKLTVAGATPREYIWPSGGGNPELDFGNQVGDSHWAIYRDLLTDELRFWRGENNLTVTSQGDVNSKRCFGPVYVGQTAASYTGNLNGAVNVGYDDANVLCAGSVPGSHVCTTGEILETIKCNRASLPVTDQAWISNGPPGYTARANDCVGWTSTSPSGPTIVYGAIWAFDANGGVGWVTTCNQSLKFSCCK